MHIEPEASGRAENGDDTERGAHARHADSVCAKSHQLVIGGQPAEDEQDGREQSPRDGEDEREWQHVGDEADEVLDRHVMVHQERQQLAENVADDQNE